MSKAKFTPGPWSWDGEVPTDYMTADWKEIAPWLVDGNGKGVLTGQIACQNPANTCLIASAPELYEALADMLSGWKYIRETHGDLYGVGWDRAQQKAETAISKARGESC